MLQSVLQSRSYVQTVNVEDCSTDVCSPIQVVLQRSIAGMAALYSPSGGYQQSRRLFVPQYTISISEYNPTIFQSIVVLSKTRAQVTNTFKYLSIPYEGLRTMASKFMIVDAIQLTDTYTSTNVNVLIAGSTTIPVTVNADVAYAGYAAYQKTRLFGHLVQITVPDSVYKLRIITTSVVDATEEIIVQFDDTECRQVVLFSLTTNQRYVFVVDTGKPTEAASNVYLLPQEPGACELPGSGGIISLKAQTFDATGAQIAATVTVETWRIPYSPYWNQTFMPFVGLQGNFSPAVQNQISSFAVPNVQPSFS